MNKQNCPTCNAPCEMTWSGLDLVENTGDETLAQKHYTYSIPVDEDGLWEMVGELITGLSYNQPEFPADKVQIAKQQYSITKKQ